MISTEFLKSYSQNKWNQPKRIQITKRDLKVGLLLILQKDQLEIELLVI